jgi:hypothetical protein
VAWASWRFVERPFRQAGRFAQRQVFAGAAMISALFLALGLGGFLTQGFARPGEDTELLQAFEDPSVRATCDQGYRGDGRGIEPCYFGAPAIAGHTDVAVFGDSHSEAMLPTFDEAGRHLG